MREVPCSHGRCRHIAALAAGAFPRRPRFLSVALASATIAWLVQRPPLFHAGFVLSKPSLTKEVQPVHGHANHRHTAVRAAGVQSSEVWSLPSVEKGTSDFYAGQAATYAWVQSSTTLYLFAPLKKSEDDASEAPAVDLEVVDEGTKIGLTINGDEVLRGELANSVKPGTDIWMVEDGPDGQEFIVVEVDKTFPGSEWTSVLRPEVNFLEDYSQPKVVMQRVTPQEQANMVEDTLGHLQKGFGQVQVAADDHTAVNGDLLTVDIQGFELTDQGTRGAPLDIGASQGMKIELGAAGPAGGSLMPEIHQQLVGVTKGKVRDVQVTLGKRAGEMGGQRIIIGVTCREMQQQVLPELSDELARKVKQDEQFRQAGTEEGIPEEEERSLDTFTLADLRIEILAEIRQAAEKEEIAKVTQQLEAVLQRSAEVRCEWGDLSGGKKSVQERVKEEEFAAIVGAVADREGLTKTLDNERLKKETWDLLGTPKEGKTIADVGDDPDREFQEANIKVVRRNKLALVLDWLEERMELVAPGGEGEDDF